MTDESPDRRVFMKSALASAVTLAAIGDFRQAVAADETKPTAAAAPTDAGANPSGALSPYFRGDVTTPTSPGYDGRRRLVNAAIDKKPAMIVRCVGAADVIAAVRYAREHQLEIAVRGGGHHIGGFASTQGGMLIDLSLMEKSVRVDPKARTARIEGGARAIDVISETSPFGLAAIVAGVANVGISGHALGGGNGDLSAIGGFACDNILSADIVTADAKLVTCSADENEDLFWAIRGAGANFGIVTSLLVTLHPLPATVQSGMMIYDLSKAGKVLKHLRDFSAGPSLACSIVCYVGPLPPDPHIPERLRGHVAIMLSICHSGTEAEAAADLKAWRDFEKPDVDLMGPTTYLDFINAAGAAYPHNRQFWDARHSTDLTDEMISIVIEQAKRLEKLHLSGHQFIAFYPLKGAMATAPASPCAYNLRGGWDFPVLSFWNDAADDDLQITWAQSVTAAMLKAKATTPGAYLNFVSRPTGQRVRDFYGATNYARLQQLKLKYDPDNTFHLNPNVPPAKSGA